MDDGSSNADQTRILSKLLQKMAETVDANNPSGITTSTIANKEVPKARKKRSASVEKWGLAGVNFTQVPNILLDNKKRLELNDAEFLLLLHLIKHWWGNDSSLPFPSKSKLAKVLGKDERQVQRILKSLETNPAPLHNEWSDEPGYITRIARHAESGRQRSNEFDLSKLKNALKCLALEIESAKENINERKPASKAKTKPPSLASLRAKGYL